MMMAHDPTPQPGPSLTRETLARASAALSRYIKDPNGSGEQLRETLDAMAAEARDKAIPPEQLLVALKDAWYALPGARIVDESGSQARLLQTVVTMCIKEYYRSE